MVPRTTAAVAAHYDELDLLRPADTDRWTGYRRYRREQLETARTIALLRELEVPLDEVFQYPDGEAR